MNDCINQVDEHTSDLRRLNEKMGVISSVSADTSGNIDGTKVMLMIKDLELTLQDKIGREELNGLASKFDNLQGKFMQLELRV